MDKLYSYTKTAKFLHWFMAFIWIFVWIMGMLAVYGRETFNPQYGLTAFHKAVASTLLLLVVIRIICRLIQPAPPLPNSMSQHAQQITRLGHIVIYTFVLLAMPLSGWLLSSFAGKTVLMAGFIPLPMLATPNAEYAGLVREWHTYLAWFCGTIVLGHIVLALKHHLIDKDTVLTSMLPHHKKK